MSVLAACALLSACGSSSPESKAAASIAAATVAQKSVHWNEAELWCSARRTSDVEADSGTQRVTSDCDGAKGQAQVVLVADVAYVQGNSAGLEYTLDLTKAQARRYAGRWISISPGLGLYVQAADGLTLASIVHDVTPEADGSKLNVVTRRGTRILVLWRQEDDDGHDGTLSAQGTGDPLPVAFTASGVAGFSSAFRGRFSKWNEPLHIQAPARSTPIATVCGACPDRGPTGPRG